MRCQDFERLMLELGERELLREEQPALDDRGGSPRPDRPDGSFPDSRAGRTQTEPGADARNGPCPAGHSSERPDAFVRPAAHAPGPLVSLSFSTILMKC